MQENNNAVVKEETEKVFPLWRIIYKSIWLILLITVICGAIGVGLAFLRAKPSYTATRNILLNVEFEVDGNSNEINNNTLGKRILPTIADIISTPEVVKRANEDTNGNAVAGAIKVNYSENSLIFSISYTARTEIDAITNLESIVVASSDIVREKQPTVFSEIEFVQTHDEPMINKNTNRTMYVLAGFLGGLVLGVVVAIMVFVLDNKVKDGYELEEITGSSVIAIIEKSN